MKIVKRNLAASGFTVMELVVALALATIVLAIAIPSFTAWLPVLRLDNAGRQIATDLQVARMRAISQNASYTITFNVGTESYSYPSSTIDIDERYPGIDIVSVSTNPVFSPRGTANSAATIQLSNGDTQKWVCVKVVGRVNLQDSTC